MAKLKSFQYFSLSGYYLKFSTKKVTKKINFYMWFSFGRWKGSKVCSFYVNIIFVTCFCSSLFNSILFVISVFKTTSGFNNSDKIKQFNFFIFFRTLNTGIYNKIKKIIMQNLDSLFSL